MTESKLTIGRNGEKYWEDKNGSLHREDGPAYDHPNGHKKWLIHGKYHRVNGPAIEYSNGGKEWWVNGERHREDGPAIKQSNGYEEWWFGGKLYSKIEWEKIKSTFISTK